MSTARRILLLTPQLPYPPRQGTSLRNYNLLAHLARRHTIDLMALLQPGETLDDDSPLHVLCRRIVTAPVPRRSMANRLRAAFTTLLPDMALRLESPTAWQVLRPLLAQETYDVVQIEGIEMAAYGLAAAGLRLTPGARLIAPPTVRPRIVFDDHNAEYVLQQRAWQTDRRRPLRWPAALYSLIQWQKLRRYERLVCRYADAVAVVSANDAAALRRLLPDLEPAIVPNGVDLDAYAPGRVQPLDLGPAALVFTGKMDFRPNIDAVEWMLPILRRVREAMPQARLYVVGQQPHPRLLRLAAEPGVVITGAVPDTRPYIAGATIYVVPLRVGGGTRLKVLEAMAFARAIVSTRLGIEGFDFADGRELRLADTSEAFASAIIDLLEDPQARARLGAAARAAVEECYGWERIVPRLERLYDA